MSHSSDKPRSESFKLGIADTGPISAAAIRGEAATGEISARQATEEHRRLRVETEPIRQEKGWRRLASGTSYLRVPKVPDAARVSRADTVEDFCVSRQAKEG